MKIIKVKDASEQTYLNAILYGETGFGKTFSISTIPEQEKCLIFSAESGLKTIQSLCPETDCAIIRSIEDMVNAAREIKAMCDLEPDERPYHTVVIDSLSEIAELILEAEKEKNADGRVYYSSTSDRIIGLCRLFRDLPLNTIFVCQQEKIQDADGRIFYGPSFPGKKTAQKLPYQFDIVACLRVQEDEEGVKKRAFQLDPADNYIAKARGGNFQPFEKPDWTNIFEKYNQIEGI